MLKNICRWYIQILSLEIEDLEKLKKLLNPIGEKFQTEFYIGGADYGIEEMPKNLQDNCIELTIE